MVVKSIDLSIYQSVNMIISNFRQNVYFLFFLKKNTRIDHRQKKIKLLSTTKIYDRRILRQIFWCL